MKDLFVEETPQIQLEKTAESYSFFLNQDHTKWIKEIVSYFLEQFPYLQEEAMSISWTKKDPEKGYAVGSLEVIDVSVPVIIKEFRLSPMDVMILPEAIVPLNDFFLKQIYNKPDAFKGVRMDRKSVMENLFGGSNHLQYSPTDNYGSASGSNRTTRDAVKVASVIDKLSFVHRDDVMEILEELKDPIVKKAFEKNGHLDLIKKLVDKSKQSTKTASLDDYVRNLEIDRQLTYRDKNGQHFIKQANSRFNKTWTTKISTLESQEQEEMLLNKQSRPKLEKIASKTEKKPIRSEKGAFGEIGTVKEGEFSPLVELMITNIEKVADRPKFANWRIDTGGSERLTVTTSGEYVKTASELEGTANFDDFEGSEPKIGDHGIFVTEKTATAPVTITKMSKVAGPGNWTIEGEGEFFSKLAFYPVKVENEGFEQHETEKTGFYVPKNAKWIKLDKNNEKLANLKNFEAKIKVEGLNGFDKVAFYLTDQESPATWLEKEAVYLINADDFLMVEDQKSGEIIKNANSLLNNHQVFRDKAGLYNLSGPEFTKYAQEHPVRNLSELDAKWALVHCGGVEEDLEKFAGLEFNRSFEVEGQLKAPMSLNNLDEIISEEFEKTASHKMKVSRLLVKEAATLTDKTSVDAVLSLNLLRTRNVTEYIDALPIYEEALTNLSKLLIASRLGLQSTSPDAVKNAMTGLSEVVEQLYQLQATIKKVN